MKKKVISIVIAIVVIAAAVLGILYFTTDLFKSSEQLFYKHIEQNAKLLGSSDYAKIMEEVKSELDGPKEVSGEMTMKMSIDDPSIKATITALEKGKITYNIKTVGSEQKGQGDVTLNYNGKDVVTLNVLKNKEQYGIKVAEAYDKYISVENNNLKALAKKLGMDSSDVPDKIEMVDYYELLNIDKDTLKTITTTYSDIVKQNISEESYSIENGVIVKIDGADVTTNAYKLTLTENQLKNVLVKVLETLKSDETTLNLIIDKYNMMMEPYKAMGMEMSGTTELTKESLVKAIEDELKELNNTSANDQKALELIAYGSKENKAKIEINAIENEKTVAKANIDMVKEDKNDKMIIELTVEDTTMNMEISGNDENTNVNFKALSEDMKMEIAAYEDKQKVEATAKLTSEGMTVETNIKEDIKATENVTVEDFTTENSVKLNDMTEAELNTLFQTVYTNVMKVLPEKMQLLGIKA